MLGIEIACNEATFRDRPSKQRIQGARLIVLGIQVDYHHAVDREPQNIAGLEGPDLASQES